MVRCEVPMDQVIALPDVTNLYHVPLNLLRQRVHILLAERLRLGPFAPKTASYEHREPHDYDVIVNRSMHSAWTELARTHDELEQLQDGAKIAVIGKYTGLQDSYLSVAKALTHAAMHTRQKLITHWVDSEVLEARRRGTPVGSLSTQHA
jgi:CTP synthase